MTLAKLSCRRNRPVEFDGLRLNKRWFDFAFQFISQNHTDGADKDQYYKHCEDGVIETARRWHPLNAGLHCQTRRG